MKKSYGVLFTLLFLLFLTSFWVSCKEFIEPNIAGNEVVLVAPGNGLQSSKYAVTFNWEQADDALNYRFQIVSPGFDSISTVVVDTIITANKFTVSLDPGKYQWHLRAQNGSSQTAYSGARGFTILSSSIKQQKVQQQSPGNGITTNQSAVTFAWGDVYGATRFRLQIDTSNFTDTGKLVYNQTTPGLTVKLALQKDQSYQWRVRAENDTASSLWSSISVITYDHTPPAKPLLSSPAKGITVPMPVNLQWAAVTTATKYRLYVFKSDSVTTYNNTFPLLQMQTNYSFALGTFNERIYWRITAIDAAGNESQGSELRNFIVQ